MTRNKNNSLIHSKVCGVCNREFYPLAGNQKFCSDYCRHLDPINREKRLQRRKLLRESRLKFIRRIKTFYGCSLCGYNGHPAALQFDHLNPEEKSFDIAKAHMRSLDSMKSEIKKCRILCANCHSVHTFNQNKEDFYADDS